VAGDRDDDDNCSPSVKCISVSVILVFTFDLLCFVNLLWWLPIGFVVLIFCVGFAQELRHVPAVASFITRYPGTVPPPNGVHGIPTWVGWQHFFKPSPSRVVMVTERVSLPWPRGVSRDSSQLTSAYCIR